MKKYLLLVLLTGWILPLTAQIYDPVSWEFFYESKGRNEYEIVLRAIIEEKSHIYAMNLPDEGPIPTTVKFEESAQFSLVGEVFEMGEAEIVFDEAFKMNITWFSHEVEFRQKITSDAKSFVVKGYVNYMACDDSRCSPPQDKEFEITVVSSSAAKATSEGDGGGLLKFFLISILAGLAGVVTPCVFPMIPMTVAFFSRDSGSRAKSILSAFIFGLSIIIIYSSLGVIVSLTSAGAGFANALSTHWIPNVLFFTLFIVFASSFFGAFEIILPHKWTSSADSKVDKGGMIASFFLGLTTVLVSFSCTGPIVGALLVEAASGDVLRPTIGMFGFGLAFATPFTIFALFPSVLRKMPKSGGWLNSIKVVLGFIMLAFSLKFVSTVDDVYQLGILNRDIFIAIWIVLFALMGFYLLGKIRFSHDSDVPHIGVFRLFLAIAVFTFVVYLIPGLFGAPLKGLSGLMPSRQKSTFNLERIISSAQPVSAVVPAQGTALTSEACGQPLYGDFLQLPHGLTGYFELKQGLACAKEQGKPVLLDFKGHACSNCKEMEAKVWSDPEVLSRLRDNFVIIALYVDDRTKLPESEWITSPVDGKVKNTMGKVNEDIEISRFRTNALPLYVITDHEGNQINEPRQHNLDVQAYIEWLDEGYNRFMNMPR
ncbi:MAG: thioredoxin family protein [Bacteroidales bacterium]|nr:thioredoxin family protein [Bacteroidales bacterium]